MRSGQSRNRHGWVLNSDGAFPAADTTCRVADSDNPNAVLMMLQTSSCVPSTWSVEFDLSYVVAPLAGCDPVRGRGSAAPAGEPSRWRHIVA